LRSGYLSEANVDAAWIYISGGVGWYGPGWYWDPWFRAYTFVPGDGTLYSPFGWGFYSPIIVYRPPFYYGFARPHEFREFHYPYGHGFEPRGGFLGGGFRGGGAFHGGGGGRR
jgi:hypothetical protein